MRITHLGSVTYVYRVLGQGLGQFFLRNSKKITTDITTIIFTTAQPRNIFVRKDVF